MCHGAVTYGARIMEIERRETEDGWNAFHHRQTPRTIDRDAFPFLAEIEV